MYLHTFLLSTLVLLYIPSLLLSTINQKNFTFCQVIFLYGIFSHISVYFPGILQPRPSDSFPYTRTDLQNRTDKTSADLLKHSRKARKTKKGASVRCTFPFYINIVSFNYISLVRTLHRHFIIVCFIYNLLNLHEQKYRDTGFPIVRRITSSAP